MKNYDNAASSFNHRAWDIEMDDGLVTDYELLRSGAAVLEAADEAIGYHLAYRRQFPDVRQFDDLVIYGAAGWPWAYTISGAGMRFGFAEAAHVVEFVKAISESGDKQSTVSWQVPEVAQIEALGIGDELLSTCTITAKK